MTHPNPTTLPSPQVQVRNERTAAMVPCRAPMWTDIVSDAGAGSLILQVADEATVQDGDMLTGIVHGIIARRRVLVFIGDGVVIGRRR